jgi:hypothetical protein
MRIPVRSVALAVLMLAACTTASPPASTTTATLPAAVPITNFQMIAGKWAGPVMGLPRQTGDEGDWVEVTIREDGSYDFGIIRTIGMFGGKGKFVLKDGKMTSQGERGRAEYVLIESGGKQHLRADGVVQTSIKVTADLTRVR